MELNNSKITILPAGPYEVSADIPLKQSHITINHTGLSLDWKDDNYYALEEKEPYHLCRCGHSKDKPYCDGTHKQIGFEGEETAGHESYLSGCTVYEGETLDLYDNEDLCASLRFCDRGARVWDAAIYSGNPELRQQAIEESMACSAGRLTVVDKATGKAVEPQLPREIGLVEDTAAQWQGPLRVQGGITLTGADGQPYEQRNRMTLCRCGESGNMPFCDTSHLSCPHMRGLDAPAHAHTGHDHSMPPPLPGADTGAAQL